MMDDFGKFRSKPVSEHVHFYNVPHFSEFVLHYMKAGVCKDVSSIGIMNLVLVVRS